MSSTNTRNGHPRRCFLAEKVIIVRHLRGMRRQAVSSKLSGSRAISASYIGRKLSLSLPIHGVSRISGDALQRLVFDDARIASNRSGPTRPAHGGPWLRRADFCCRSGAAPPAARGPTIRSNSVEHAVEIADDVVAGVVHVARVKANGEPLVALHLVHNWPPVPQRCARFPCPCRPSFRERY